MIPAVENMMKQAGGTDTKQSTAFETYYSQARKEYLLQDTSGGWVPINETGFKRILRSKGYDTRINRGEMVSEVEQVILDTQLSRNVHYAGPVAGYSTGFYETAETRFLVTDPPRIIKADPNCEWETLKGILTRMLGDIQLQYFWGWLKTGRSALITERRTPGQALAIAGPKDCGKSLLQNLLTLMLGGRAARPYQFMAGQTPFNAHLFAAEHLMVEDESPFTDHKARRAMGSMIKALTVNENQSCHRKGATPIQLRPFWRVSITLNDEPENLMVLPPLDESLEDKIILLKAESHSMPMPTAAPEDRERFWNQLVSELPGLLAYAESFAIPEELVSQRFGVTHFHHPELVCQLDSLAPESKLLSIIENHLTIGSASWVGQASDLERAITDRDCPYHYEARKLLSWPTACGTYLGRLRRRYPARFEFSQKGSGRERTWTIYPREGERSERQF